MKQKIFINSCLSLITLMYIGCGSGEDSEKQSNPDSIENSSSYTISVIDDAVVDAKVEAVGCMEAKDLGQGQYRFECSDSPKYISAKGGFVDLNKDGKHDSSEVSMGLPLLVNLDEKLFDVDFSNIAITPLSTLVANIQNRDELEALAKKLGIDKKDFNKDISKTNKELFQKLNALLIVAESSGIRDQLLLMKKLREKIVLSSETAIGNILKDALEKLKNDPELKKAYGEVFISGFINESQGFMDAKDILSELSKEYSDNDDSKVFITGFIYDALISNANIAILDGNKKVGEVKTTDRGRWKIAIAKSVLVKDKVLIFTGTATDSNGDNILLKSAITTQKLREISKRRISVADSIDLVISNVTTAQVAILEKNDKDFLTKAKELEERKNKIEIFQQETLLKASSAIKSVIDGDSKIDLNENTYSFIFDNLIFEDGDKDKIELNLDGKISDAELKKQSDTIKADAILSQQLLSIESEKTLTPLLDKSLYRMEYSGSPLTKKYKKIVVSKTKLTEKSYELKRGKWQETSYIEHRGKIQNNIFYFDTKNSTAPYAVTLKEQKTVHSVETNKDYSFDILGQQLYLPYKNEETTKVSIDVYAESFDVVTVFKELDESKIVKALGSDYTKGTREEDNLALSRYLIAKVSEKLEPFDRTKTKLDNAINVFENMDIENDDIDVKLSSVKSILSSAKANDHDAQVGKALFSLAEITNSPTLGNLIELNVNGSSISINDNLASLIEGNDNLEMELLSSITDLSETSMQLVHETVLKLQDINSTLGVNFADTNYIFKYDGFELTNHQVKLLRVGILTIASKLEYMTAFDYVTADDIKTRTTVLNGISAEYNNFSANPLPILQRSDFGALNSTVGAERLAHSKALLLEAIDVLDTVVATNEDDADRVSAIKDTQKEMAKLKSSLNGSSLYTRENEENGITVITAIDLSALYSASTALDLTHTVGHDLEYRVAGHAYEYDHTTQKNYISSGNYNLELSQFYNEPMGKEWIAEDGSGSTLTYDYFGDSTPDLESELKTIPTGSNSHIPSVIKKIEIKESGKATITHTGDNVLKYLFNDLEVKKDHSISSSSSITYYVNKKEHLIPDTTIRYRVNIHYGDVEIINANPITGEVTVKAKSGIIGYEPFALDVYDTLGHNQVVRDLIEK